MGKLYLLHYPAFTGMGSDVDEFLITEENLRKIIEKQIDNKKNGRAFDERLTGTWNDEKFCKSPDLEKQIENVIQKRLLICSTYAEVPDLIELPSDIEIKVVEESLNKRIFRLFNQFGFKRDIIVGTANFKRIVVDFGESYKNYGLKNPIAEFDSYNLQNVVENHFDYTDYTKLIEVERNKLQRVKEVNDNKLHKGIFTEKQRRAWNREMKHEAYATLEKFKRKPKGKDTYLWHIYRNDDNKYYKKMLNESLLSEKGDKLSFVRMAYKYPLFPYTEFCEIEEKKEESNFYTYGELFEKGANISMLASPMVCYLESKEKIGTVKAESALYTVFGYD